MSQLIFHVYIIEVIAADITSEDTINIIHYNNQRETTYMSF